MKPIFRGKPHMLPCWNHNAAYYPQILRKTAGYRSVLDVGCGNGTLVHLLDDGTHILTGIDPDGACIAVCRKAYGGENARFLQGDFLFFASEEHFDAILFVASLHHMDMASALEKAKALLAPNGRLIVVGLSTPSSVSDWMLEILRLLPVKLISAIRGMKTSEEIGVPVSYRIPPMRSVRKLAEEMLPGARIRRGLYYRYLLIWTKK